MIKSYCKINLFLKVIKKNNKGLHHIQSTAMLIDLHDTINITKIKKKKIASFLMVFLKKTLITSQTQ